MTNAIDKLDAHAATTRGHGYDVRTVAVTYAYTRNTASIVREFTVTADLHPDRSFALWAAAEIARDIAAALEHELAGKIAAELEGKA